MAIHYDKKLKRFRDDTGRLVSKQRAMKSSVARAEYAKAQKVSRAKTAKPPKKDQSPKTKVPAKSKPPRKKAKQHPTPPWEGEVVREYPEPESWFPDVDHDEYWYSYEDFLDDWGDFDDEETTS